MEQLIQSSIDAINEYAQEQISELLAEFEKNLFKAKGAFNGRDEWEENALQVQEDKGNDNPLVDTGELRREMTNSKNWKDEISSYKTKNKAHFFIPEEENFNNPKYNKLQTGFSGDPYISPRGKLMFSPKGFEAPARPFKDIRPQDVTWVAQQLAKKLKGKFSNG